MTRRAFALVRYLTLALTAWWVLTPVATAAHAMRHAHRYCAEHRAFEEGRGAALGPERDGGSSQSPVVLPSDSSRGVEHLRCAVAPPAARDVCITADHRAAAAPDVARVTLAVAWRSHYPPIAHLALAPKSSPPRA